MTSACWARNALPRSVVQSSFSSIIARTCGNAVSDLTLASHDCFCIASSSALPLTFGFCFDQRAASTTSMG
jgi:hypothetical protein